MKKFSIVIPLILLLALHSCEKDRGINLFTKTQDVDFGKQMKAEIGSSTDYNVLSRSDYPEAYKHIDSIMYAILNNAEDIKNGTDVFNWEVNIIDDDVLNAFACPGGYMYFYTGLIKYLDNEAQFAGVLAHEMAHVELRHSTRQMTDHYGYSLLIDILLGQADSYIDTVVNNVATGLTQLAFSRKFEYQADEYAVKFLSDTDYDPRGVAGFFEKLESEKTKDFTPVFLKTHPSPEDRVEKIYEHWEEEGSLSGNPHTTEYNYFKSLLP